MLLSNKKILGFFEENPIVNNSKKISFLKFLSFLFAFFSQKAIKIAQNFNSSVEFRRSLEIFSCTAWRSR
jgi:hypothetical protein